MLFVVLVVIGESFQHPRTATSPPLADIDPAKVRRAKRTWRQREGVPITGRDEAVMGLAHLAGNLLIDQPEIRMWLSRAADLWQIQIPGYWAEVGVMAREWEPVLDEAQIDGITQNWAIVREKRRLGGPAIAAASHTGRPGNDRTMTPEVVLLVVRSIALRPRARVKLNDERRRGYHVTRQRGHEHQLAGHAHGVIQADELAAEEVNRRQGWEGTHRMKAKTVTKHRERLIALLRQP